MANIMRIGGGSGGGGLNIAYGTTPPSDTSKLWVPLTQKPDNVEISGESLQDAVEVFQIMKATLPKARSYMSSVAIDGKAYIFGGEDNAGNTQYNTIYEYDPIADTLTQKTATLPTVATRVATVAIGGKAYIFGGQNGTTVKDTIYEYNPVTNKVTTKTAKLPVAIHGASAAAINGKAYIFGGYGYSYMGGGQTAIYEYDPSTNTIATKTATLPVRLGCSAAVAINGKAYIIGGCDNDAAEVRTIYEYDPVADTLTKKSGTLPAAADQLSAVAINGKAYVFGGCVYNATSKLFVGKTTICEYDPSTDTRTTKTQKLSAAMYAMAAAEIDGKAYIFGGETKDEYLDTIQEYMSQAYLGVNHLKVFASVYKNETYQVITKIINGEKEQVKLYMTAAFLGGADGYAMEQEAYVYDEANSEWQALDGTSMTTDMLNALAELGVT